MRIASLRYQRPGDVSMANVPTALVGGTRRPVLSRSPETHLLRRYLEPTPGGKLRLEIAIPEALRGAPLRLLPTVAAFAARLQEIATGAAVEMPLFKSDADLDMPLESFGAMLAGHPALLDGIEPRVLSAPGARERVEVTLDRPLLNGGVLVVTGRSLPDEGYITPPLSLPADARLRLAIGLEDRASERSGPPAILTVSMREGEREREVFRSRLDPSDPGAHRWQEHDVPLTRAPREGVQLRFSTTIGKADAAGAGTSFPLWGAPTVVAPALGSAENRRNLLLISLDTLRADHLGSYGYRRPTSPVIDELLAKQGTVFENAFTALPHTTGGHMTLLTGLDPCVHGVTGPSDPPLRSDAATLAELLRAREYETAAFTEDGWITVALGFARGFGTFVENRSPYVVEGQAATTFRAALEWMRTHRGPWFLFVHTYQVHAPYTPPPGYVEEVAADHGDGRSEVDAARYDGEIRYTDDLLAELLSGVDAVGPPGTVVVLVSDHGEHFGEHGLSGHDNSLYDALLHVPLIVRAPGLVPAGKRIDTPVGAVDVVPTVLDLLGLPAAPRVQGVSLVPLLQDIRPRPRTLFAELPRLDLVAARQGPLKWIINTAGGARSSAFNTRIDPNEDKVVGMPGAGQRLLEDFQRHCAALPPPAARGTGPTLDPAVTEKLRALGYLN